MKEYEMGFLRPPKEYTQIPFWFLNGEVDGLEYGRQIKEMAEKGVFQAMPHPRFGMDRRDYLTEKYWTAFKQLLTCAGKIDFTIHLYDEYNWASGPAGGRVTSDIRNCALGIGMSSKTGDGPSTIVINSWCNGLKGWGRKENWLGIAIAPWADKSEIRIEQLKWLELPPKDCEAVNIEIPKGRWEAMVFYTIRTVHPSPLRMGNGGIIDYLSARSTACFIQHTHEKYKEQLGEYFGDIIKSIFYDESAPYASGPFTWTEDFPRYFKKAKGYDIIPLLPLLFYNGGDLTEKVRCDYWDVLSEIFTENHIGQMARWCEKNEIFLTGHTYEEPDRWMLSGDPMRTLRRQDLVGIDSLQGYKSYHVLKVGASVANITGKTGLLCEALGIMDFWQASPRKMKQAYNQLAVIGVTHMVPHAFFQTIDNPKVECPPSFFEHNAYWKYYKIIADMTARHCWMNSQGHHLSDIALLYPIVSWWGDAKGGRGYGFPWEVAYEDKSAEADRKAFEKIINLLMKNQMDLNVIDSEALSYGEICGCELKIAQGCYKVLIVPPMNTIKLSDMLKIHDFCVSGGKVIFVGKWPKVTMENGRNDAQLMKLIHQIKDRVFFVETVTDIINCIEGCINPDVVVLEGCKHNIDVCHRTVGRSHVYAVSNTSDNYEAIRVKLRERGKTSVWYPETGSICPMHSEEEEDGTVIKLKMDPFELVYIVFDGEDITKRLSMPIHKTKMPDKIVPIEGMWEFMPVSSGVEKEWSCVYKSDFLKVPVMKKIEKGWQEEGESYNIWDEWYKSDFDDNNWETVHCLRQPVKSDNSVSVLLRLPIPIGARGVNLPLPVSGEHAVYINGKCYDVVLEHLGENEEKIKVFEDLQMKEISQNRGILAIECASMAPDNGLEVPVEFYMEPVEVELTSWKNLGLWWYSGFGVYRKTIIINQCGYTSIFIDLGDVRECAEVWINGELAGVRLWPPYRVEITSLVKPGENEVIIIASNLLSNRFSWDVWGTRGKGEVLDSGLLGPVCLEIYE